MPGGRCCGEFNVKTSASAPSFLLGEVPSASVEAKVAELLRSIASFLSSCPAVPIGTIQAAVASLLATIKGKAITLEDPMSAVVRG